MITVEDILMVKGPDVIVTAPTTTVLEAAQLMAEDNVGSVIVRDDEGLLGIFTERDLLRRVVARGKDPAKLVMTDVMSSPVKCCSLSDTIHDCAHIFATSKIRHLAVIEDGALVGMVGLRDLHIDEIHPVASVSTK